VLHEPKFENPLEGAHRVIDLARSMNPHVKGAVEPSANYCMKIYDKLEDGGVEVKLSNPSGTKAIAEARLNEQP
ncbi:hypothetical protein, partial [[Eubacterium] cellulosolvens]